MVIFYKKLCITLEVINIRVQHLLKHLKNYQMRYGWNVEELLARRFFRNQKCITRKHKRIDNLGLLC